MALTDFLKGGITNQFWAKYSDASPVAAGQSAPPSGTHQESGALYVEVLEERVAPAGLLKRILTSLPRANTCAHMLDPDVW
jgi:hypothetical protein